ncbi:MAG: ABC transporter permease [Planctomycetes bacterium]|nr:ABC transporter permease [Planctomycetota bacterium]
MLADLYRNRSYIWRTAWADVRHRYAGSAAGVMWNVLQPLSLILVFSVIFTQVIDRGVLGQDALSIAYPVYLCSGLLPWLALSECLSRGTLALTQSAGLLRRLALPESVFVARAALSAGIGLAISMGLFLPIAWGAFGLGPSVAWLALLGPAILLIIFGFGLSLALAAVHALIRDTATLVTIVLQVGFWCYPVVYHRSFLPGWAERILIYNPAYPFLQSIRTILLLDQLPGPGLWLGMLAWTLTTCAIGSTVLRALRSSVRDSA